MRRAVSPFLRQATEANEHHDRPLVGWKDTTYTYRNDGVPRSRRSSLSCGPSLAGPLCGREFEMASRRHASCGVGPFAPGTRCRSIAVGALVSLVCGLTTVTFLSPGIASAAVAVNVPCSGP